MLTVSFIRHGESAANAGATTSDPAAIPLTARGVDQACTVAANFVRAPDWIVCSNFLRAHQTALPTLERYPDVPLHFWPIHEFTYLSPALCAGTSAAMRRPWVEAFWNDADPLSIHGSGAESFFGFFARVDAALERFASLPGTSGAVFGHGQFMQAIRWRIAHPNAVIDADAMRDFRCLDLAHPIANTQGFLASFDGLAWICD